MAPNTFIHKPDHIGKTSKLVLCSDYTGAPLSTMLNFGKTDPLVITFDDTAHPTSYSICTNTYYKYSRNSDVFL